MNIKQLEYFMVVSECKNITEAAERLHMAQPPLSRAIKNLEEDLGTTLFFRSNKGMQLTDTGRLLHTEASQLLKQMDNLQAMIRESSKGLCGNIKIGACYSTLPIITKKMNAFLKQHNACTFSMVHGTINELESWLHDGIIDILFLRNCIVESSEFIHVKLEDDPLCFVIHKDMDNKPDEETVDVDFLRDIPLCILDETRFPGSKSELFSTCEARGFTPHIICTCYDNSAGLALAQSRVAATFLPKSTVEMNPCDYLHIKSIRGMNMSSRPTMIYNPNIYHTRSLDAFIDEIAGKKKFK